MGFKTINMDNVDNDTLLSIIMENCRIASDMRTAIKKAEEAKSLQDASSESFSDTLFDTCDDTHYVEDSLDDEFEKTVDYYLTLYRNLDVNFNKIDLFDILPRENKYRYRDIIMRLYLASITDVKEYNSWLEDLAVDDEERIEMLSCIDSEKRKIKYLSELLFEKEDETVDILGASSDESINEILLAPIAIGRDGNIGNIRIISDLVRDITPELYPLFSDLLMSIRNGSFKGLKPIVSDFSGVYELRKKSARILFKRMGENKYAVITAFVKKTDRSNYHMDILKTRIASFALIYDRLKELLKDSSFMKDNDKNVDELFKILGVSFDNDDSKKKKELI